MEASESQVSTVQAIVFLSLQIHSDIYGLQLQKQCRLCRWDTSVIPVFPKLRRVVGRLTWSISFPGKTQTGAHVPVVDTNRLSLNPLEPRLMRLVNFLGLTIEYKGMVIYRSMDDC